ncbi:MAG: hypothetical protein WC003_09125 [Terrimicrobiaceae bacterium]
MKFRILRQDGRTLDEMESGGLRVRIARTGAEMVSLALGDKGVFEKKAGIQVIPPGDTLKRGFSIQPSLLT